MFTVIIFLIILGYSEAVSSFSLSPERETQFLISEDVRDQLETRLMDTCGSQCVDFFQQVYPLISNVSVSINDTKSISDQFKRFNNFFDSLVSDGQSINLKLTEDMETLKKTVSSFASSSDPQPIQPGLPCRTQAECDALEFPINRCSHIRNSAMDAYNKANVAVNVLAQLISTMCGCVFTGPVSLCILAPIPYVCGFPFEAYRGLFGLSMALWSAVKATTGACSFVGADIASLTKFS